MYVKGQGCHMTFRLLLGHDLENYVLDLSESIYKVDDHEDIFSAYIIAITCKVFVLQAMECHFCDLMKFYRLWRQFLL